MSKSIKLDQIDFTNGVQVRAALDTVAIAEYAGEMEDGAKFPPVELYEIEGNDKLLVADGWHRIHASLRNDYKDILANVTKGTRAEYIKAAMASNMAQGMRRTNADKHNAVLIGLKELSQLSDRQIAEIVGVSNSTVGNIRAEVATPAEAAKPAKRVDKKGVKRTVKPLVKAGRSKPVKQKVLKLTKAQKVQAGENQELFSILANIVGLAKEARKYISKKAFDQKAEVDQIIASCGVIKDSVKDEMKDAETKAKEGAKATKKAGVDDEEVEKVRASVKSAQTPVEVLREQVKKEVEEKKEKQ